MPSAMPLIALPAVLPHAQFVRALSLERKRAERSRKPFVLLVIDLVAPGTDIALLDRSLPSLVSSLRETDIVGWHNERASIAVIFAELGESAKETILTALRAKVTAILAGTLRADEVARMRQRFYWFPEEWTADTGQPIGTLYPDLVERNVASRVPRAIKRAIDLFGSLLALVLLAPVLLAVAAAIKLSSPGPVLFRQTRFGQYGVPFTFLKFRSMYPQNDPQIHRDYVTRFIAGDVTPATSGANGKAVYKLTKDPRLTPIGAFLRKTSLDELPQFLNVLRGEMSIVGPRPPVRYELDAYDVWHRRRLLEVKPGITGLWQVNGRSRLRFDDMVRLDLEYAKNWSLWLDLKILAQTPLAIFSGEGAY